MPNIQLSVKFKTDKLSASIKYDTIQTDFIRPDNVAAIASQPLKNGY